MTLPMQNIWCAMVIDVYKGFVLLHMLSGMYGVIVARLPAQQTHMLVCTSLVPKFFCGRGKEPGSACAFIIAKEFCGFRILSPHVHIHVCRCGSVARTAAGLDFSVIVFFHHLSVIPVGSDTQVKEHSGVFGHKFWVWKSNPWLFCYGQQWTFQPRVMLYCCPPSCYKINFWSVTSCMSAAKFCFCINGTHPCSLIGACAYSVYQALVCTGLSTHCAAVSGRH